MILRKTVKGEEVLGGIIRKAIAFGAEEIEIDYKDGYEEVLAMNNWVGAGIGKIKSG